MNFASGSARGRCRPLAGVGVAMVLAAGLLSGCATQQQMVSQTEDHLAAAGFTVRPANTAARQAMLNRLPPNKFVQRTHGDEVHYVYADPVVCDCLYVGSQEAYSKYKRYLEQKDLAERQLEAAQMYSDPAWTWDAWGPWGPGYMFGPGPGW